MLAQDMTLVYRGCNIHHAVDSFEVLIHALAMAEHSGIELSKWEKADIANAIVNSRKILGHQLRIEDERQSDYEFWQQCFKKTRLGNPLTQAIHYKAQEK